MPRYRVVDCGCWVCFCFLFFFSCFKFVGKFSVEVREQTSSLSLKLFNGGKKKSIFWIFHRAAGPAARVWEEVDTYLFAEHHLSSFLLQRIITPVFAPLSPPPLLPSTFDLWFASASLTVFFFFSPTSLPFVHLLPPRLFPEMRSDTVPGRRA